MLLVCLCKERTGAASRAMQAVELCCALPRLALAEMSYWRDHAAMCACGDCQIILLHFRGPVRVTVWRDLRCREGREGGHERWELFLQVAGADEEPDVVEEGAAGEEDALDSADVADDVAESGERRGGGRRSRCRPRTTAASCCAARRCVRGRMGVT